jgi:hypothetical protein
MSRTIATSLQYLLFLPLLFSVNTQANEEDVVAVKELQKEMALARRAEAGITTSLFAHTLKFKYTAKDKSLQTGQAPNFSRFTTVELINLKKENDQFITTLSTDETKYTTEISVLKGHDTWIIKELERRKQHEATPKVANQAQAPARPRVQLENPYETETEVSKSGAAK